METPTPNNNTHVATPKTAAPAATNKNTYDYNCNYCCHQCTLNNINILLIIPITTIPYNNKLITKVTLVLTWYSKKAPFSSVFV